ncbi:hypothetical protein [Streptomyces acidicola]|uniref:hypothetical protein n=1 Tax=Streptomyces acidicola TaxID=2596892 RepID=UPI00343FBFA8
MCIQPRTGSEVPELTVKAARASNPRGTTAMAIRGHAGRWAFAALFLAITGLAAAIDHPDIQTLLWPTGSAFVVGLLYIAEGAARRNPLRYGLGTWLALTSTAALLLGSPAFYWVLTLADGGAYVLAALLERRRLGLATR